MCGLVCAVGSPDPGVLRALAATAAERGPHSYGWGFGEPTGNGEFGGWAWRFDHGSGPLPAPTIPTTRTRTVIGHSRLATTGSRPGDAPPSSESQPICAGGWVVAHNGNVPDTRALTDQKVTVDSEAIVWALLGGLPLDGLISALAGTPQALVVAHGPDVWAIRIPGARRPAHPLWALERDGTTYLCSRPTEDARALPDGVTSVGVQSA